MQSVRSEQRNEQSKVQNEAQDPVALSEQELEFVIGAYIGISGSGQ